VAGWRLFCPLRGHNAIVLARGVGATGSIAAPKLPLPALTTAATAENSAAEGRARNFAVRLRRMTTATTASTAPAVTEMPHRSQEN
jgi:hypothetical protein